MNSRLSASFFLPLVLPSGAELSAEMAIDPEPLDLARDRLEVDRTEPAFVHHRAESNFQLKCSMLDQAARSGSVILSEEYDTLLSCWADRNTVMRETLIQLLVSRNPRYSIVTCFSFVRLIVCNKPRYIML